MFRLLLYHCKKQQNEENPNIFPLQLDSIRCLGSLYKSAKDNSATHIQPSSEPPESKVG